jgi:RimJ/RimL family protein N-acetyltransferase
MSATQDTVRLSDLTFPKMPLRYGTESCHITLTDGRYTTEIIELRNDPTLGKYINYAKLSEASHERWLLGQLQRDDALNFALIARQRFSGMLSLYDIEHGKSCEFGRMMMPNDGRRIYALAAEALGMSFAFEILGVQTLYCVVMEGNDSVLNFHLRNGWKKDAGYERDEIVNGSMARLIGLSVQRAQWPECFAKFRLLAKRLF